MNQRPMVAVVGDSSLEAGSSKARHAERLGTLLIDAGFRVLTGGMGGVMEAACRGARSSAAYQRGDTVGVLPGLDPGEANPYVDVQIPTGLDHLRCGIVSAAEAVVAIGGGAGTMAEMAHAWLLRRLIIGFRVAGWSGRVADTRLDHRIRQPDLPDDRVYGVDTPEEVVPLLRDLLPRYATRHRKVRQQG